MAQFPRRDRSSGERDALNHLRSCGLRFGGSFRADARHGQRLAVAHVRRSTVLRSRRHRLAAGVIKSQTRWLFHLPHDNMVFTSLHSRQPKCRRLRDLLRQDGKTSNGCAGPFVLVTEGKKNIGHARTPSPAHNAGVPGSRHVPAVSLTYIWHSVSSGSLPDGRPLKHPGRRRSFVFFIFPISSRETPPFDAPVTRRPPD
jgi:hypothetical protein